MTKPSVPLVSIIISVYDQLEFTKKCLKYLESTLNHKLTYEVIIVDDFSKTETVNFLKGLGDPYKVYFNKSQKGFAVNNNFAANKANGEYLCFLNNDVFVQGDWLFPMIEVFKAHENVGLVGNVQKLVNSLRYDHMGVVFSPQGNPRHYGQGFFYRSFKGQVKKWSAVTAACCVTQKSLFIKLGGFDEVYTNGCEDIDLCLRMNSEGRMHYVVHDSVVLHVKGATEGRKLLNDENTHILLERWRDQIISNECITDLKLHAWNYLCRGILKPFSTSIIVWFDALLIFLNIKKLIRS